MPERYFSSTTDRNVERLEGVVKLSGQGSLYHYSITSSFCTETLLFQLKYLGFKQVNLNFTATLK